MVFGVETSGEKSNACIEIFINVPMPWRSVAITRVCRRSFAEPLVHGGAALTMPTSVHRESIGRLKKFCGTVALARLHKCKSHLMLPSEARRFFFKCHYRYFFTKTCPSDNYLFHKISVPKFFFQKYSPPPTPRLIIEWCVYNSHLAHAHRCIHIMLYIYITEKNVSMIIRYRLYYHVCDS